MNRFIRLLLAASLTLIVLLCLVIQSADSMSLSVIRVNDNAEAITTSKAMDYLDEMEQSHQQVIDHPEFLIGVDTKLMGDLAFHAGCIKQYQELKKYILEKEIPR